MGDMKLTMALRTRVESPTGGGQFETITRPADWTAAATAVIVCDMWDDHHCVSAARRVVAMAPFMDNVLESARHKGMLIIHAPSGCMDFYRDTPARARAQHAPQAAAPRAFAWNNHDPQHEGPLPPELRPGCACDTPEPCSESYPAWSRQNELITIDPADAVSDDGQEVHNLLTQHAIEHVVIMGVHTNVCVLGRPFGIRQMVYLGRDIVLCRDLTDSYHRDPGRHFQGLDRIIAHIETYWCPTITSDQITSARPFRFSDDTRPHPAPPGAAP